MYMCKCMYMYKCIVTRIALAPPVPVQAMKFGKPTVQAMVSCMVTFLVFSLFYDLGEHHSMLLEMDYESFVIYGGIMALHDQWQVQRFEQALTRKLLAFVGLMVEFLDTSQVAVVVVVVVM